MKITREIRAFCFGSSFWVTLLAAFLPTATKAQIPDALSLLPGEINTAFELKKSITCLPDSTGELTLRTVSRMPYWAAFRPITAATSVMPPVHWVRFTVQNQLTTDSLFYVNVTFTDDITLYEVPTLGQVRIERTGDLMPLPLRKVQTGQMAFVTLFIPYGETRTFYLRLESRTSISQQFRRDALGSMQLLPHEAFSERFVRNRIFQALFYGACLVMLFYNAFLTVVMRNKSYLYYVIYSIALILFFASNNGYLAEWFLNWQPRNDLYLRFLSTPFLLFFYLLFGRSYLQTKLYAPQLYRLSGYLLGLLVIIAVVMAAGYWKTGRMATVLAALVILPFLLGVAVQVLRKGFTPARYYLAANSLLLTGGVAFAAQRITSVVSHPFMQYGIQIGSVLELALFSIGLADSINLVRKELAHQQLENVQLERQKEAELKLLAEEKNRELEQKVIERTAEVVAQKEEVIAQKEEISSQNDQLERNFLALTAAQALIQHQNQELTELNQVLEDRVRERTRELALSNEELQKSNAELDHFIYRTAHDIKGPLARLQGLSYVALLEVSDLQAQDYFSKLLGEAKNLNHMLARLSTVYDIRHQQITIQTVVFQKLMDQVTQELTEKMELAELPVAIMNEPTFCLETDPALLQFILFNLIENALKFQKKKPEATHAVEVRVEHQENSIVISVLDNGIGINPEDVPHLFDMFSQAARIHRSTGLGLYMTRLGVERLGGSINWIPRPDGLTEFAVQLPVAPVMATETFRLQH